MYRLSLQKIMLAVLVLGFSGLLLFAGIQSVNAASALFGGATENGGEVVLVSDTSNIPTSDDYSGIDLDNANGTIFSTLATLSTDYDVTDDSCAGGSPRFQIDMDTTGDAVSDGNVFVYIGPSPSFSGCVGAGTTGNLIGNEDSGRWDFTQLGGLLGGYSAAPANVQSGTILGISIVVDGSWSAVASGGDSEQTVTVDNIVVNSTTYNFPETVTVTVVKHIDNDSATSTTANGASFPMSSTWNDPEGIGSGSGSYALAAGTDPAYEAQTSDMTQGADYITSENTDGAVVGANCAAGQTYRLLGYTTGSTREEALAAELSATPIQLNNLEESMFVYVWNATCVPTPSPVSPANGSATTTAGQTSIDWTDVTNNIGGITYIYEASNGSGTDLDGSFTSPIYTSAPLSDSNIPTPGVSEGTYYWHVTATDANGNVSAWSTTWSLIVDNDPTPPVEETVTVTINKRINGQQATASNASSSVFAMNASWNDPEGIGAGSGTYNLSSTTVPAYQAQTIEFNQGSDYGTSEVMGTNVGATCAAGKPYAFGGYTTGDSMLEAASSTATTTAPNFTNLQTSKFVIVWNTTCAPNTIGGDVVGGEGVLAVTSIDALDTTATADGTYENGWSYLFHITVPTNETGIAMKFSDWVSGLSTMPVANNMRISSAQANNGGATISVLAANTYTTPNLIMTGDLDLLTAGLQVQVLVGVRVPSGTQNGSYTTSYGVRSQ